MHSYFDASRTTKLQDNVILARPKKYRIYPWAKQVDKLRRWASQTRNSIAD